MGPEVNGDKLGFAVGSEVTGDDDGKLVGSDEAGDLLGVVVGFEVTGDKEGASVGCFIIIFCCDPSLHFSPVSILYCSVTVVNV